MGRVAPWSASGLVAVGAAAPVAWSLVAKVDAPTFASLGWSAAVVTGIAGLLVGRMIGFRAPKPARVEGPRSAHTALRDPVTGLPTRLLALDRLGMAIHQTRRAGGLMAVLHVELVNHGELAEQLGVIGTDHVLRAVATRVSEVVRTLDTVARIGPDELLLICPEVGSAETAAVLARRVRENVEMPIRIGRQSVAVRASVRAVVTDAVDVAAHDLIRPTEDFGGHLQTIDLDAGPVLGGVEAEGHRLDELRRAFEFGEMAIEYQPIVELETGVPVALEALVRWRHPDRGVVPAAEFVGLLESSDLIDRLAELSLGSACRDGAALWALGHHLSMHVNLSPRQLARPGLVVDVERALAETGFEPSALTLEITEARLLPESPWLVARLVQLRALGVRIAIDDFGTGYGGLARLLDLEVDMVKIDPAFTTAVDRPDARAVCGGVLSIARALHLGSVAEGVETETQELQMADLGCRWGQGKRYSPALPLPQVEAWLGAHAA